MLYRRHSCLTGSILDPLGELRRFDLWLRYCFVFLGKTDYSHSAYLSTQEYKWVIVLLNCSGRWWGEGGGDGDGIASYPGVVAQLQRGRTNASSSCTALWATWLEGRPLDLEMSQTWSNTNQYIYINSTIELLIKAFCLYTHSRGSYGKARSYFKPRLAQKYVTTISWDHDVGVL